MFFTRITRNPYSKWKSLYVHKKIHAQLVLKELVSKKKSKRQFNIKSYTFFM